MENDLLNFANKNSTIVLTCSSNNTISKQYYIKSQMTITGKNNVVITVTSEYTFNINNDLLLNNLSLTANGELFKVNNNFELNNVSITSSTRIVYSDGFNKISIKSSQMLHPSNTNAESSIIDISNGKSISIDDSTIKGNGNNNAVLVSKTSDVNVSKTNISECSTCLVFNNITTLSVANITLSNAENGIDIQSVNSTTANYKIDNVTNNCDNTVIVHDTETYNYLSSVTTTEISCTNCKDNNKSEINPLYIIIPIVSVVFIILIVSIVVIMIYVRKEGSNEVEIKNVETEQQQEEPAIACEYR